MYRRQVSPDRLGLSASWRGLAARFLSTNDTNHTNDDPPA